MIGVAFTLAVLGVLAAAAGAWWCGRGRGGRSRSLATLPRCEQATATLEFALTFPIVLGLTLILLQTALLMTGQVFVHYAAFAAARSAIVHIPMDQAHALGSARNVIVPARREFKFDAIHRAASIAVMPVSGELEAGTIDEGGAIDGDAVAAALGHYFTLRGDDVPGWVEAKVADRLRYAQDATEVTLMRTGAGDEDGALSFAPLSPRAAHAFGPRDPITVRIVHRFYLSIPYARAVFTDGRDERGDAYTALRAQYTLTNEGVEPELPEEPPLRRSDQPDDDE